MNFKSISDIKKCLQVTITLNKNDAITDTCWYNSFMSDLFSFSSKDEGFVLKSSSNSEIIKDLEALDTFVRPKVKSNTTQVLYQPSYDSFRTYSGLIGCWIVKLANQIIKSNQTIKMLKNLERICTNIFKNISQNKSSSTEWVVVVAKLDSKLPKMVVTTMKLLNILDVKESIIDIFPDKLKELIENSFDQEELISSIMKVLFKI